MKKVSGWWVTDKMTAAGCVLTRAKSLDAHITHAVKRRACIQAGGHVGVYPSRLSSSFELVVTFEPERDNFNCLVANTENAYNVFPVHGFLAARTGGRELIRGNYSGGHQMGTSGRVPAYTIDNLGLTDLDAVFLDVEGTEIQVLEGGIDTIARCKPLLVLEENDKMLSSGTRYGDLTRWAAVLGYRFGYRSAEDIVLIHKSNMREGAHYDKIDVQR